MSDERKHDVSEDTFRPGVVYQLRIILPDGVILRSTPMTGKEASAYQEQLVAVRNGMKGTGMGYVLIDEVRAKSQLVADAAELRATANMFGAFLTPKYGSFAANADHLLEAADRFEEQAASITLPN